MKRHILYLFIVFVNLPSAPAQYQNPPSVSWMQIRTPHFRVIFPENVSNRGMETATLLETAYRPVSQSMNISPGSVSVLLFNQTSISNGYTALAPRHMGFYSTPPQNATMAGGTDWLKILTVHEYRHEVQFQKLDRNLTTFFSSLAGDFGRALCMGISIPFWALEGDAVYAETLYSAEGRGRLASFTRDIRAIESENKHYSYYKAYLGSYNDYYPNHYHLGYLLTAYMYKNFGNDIMGKVFEHTTKLPVYPFIFSHALKQYAYAPVHKMYDNCMNEFSSFWKNTTTLFEGISWNKISPEIRSGYTNYSFPYYTKDETVLALKSGFDDAPTLVLLEGREETNLIEIDPVDRIHSNGTLVTWVTMTADVRWGQRDYANICIYNLETGELRVLTRKGKFFAPAVSPDGTKIACIEYGPEMNCALVILDSRKGNELFRFKFDTGEFARMPAWSADGNKLTVIVTNDQQRKLVVIDTAGHDQKEIIPFTAESISNPAFFEDYILFNSPVTGIDAIHAVHTKSSERFVVSQGMYGVYNATPSIDGSHLLIQNYTSLGNEIVEQVMDTSEWKNLSDAVIKIDPYRAFPDKQVEGGNIFQNAGQTDTSEFKIKPYRPLLHSTKVHSWYPYPVNNGVGFSVFANDFLNTTILEAGLNYYPKDVAHREYLNLSYARFFPVFDIGFSYGRNYATENDSADNYSLTEVNEKIVHAGIRIPLDFSKHIYTTGLSFGTGFNYINADFPDVDSTQIGKYRILAPEIQISFSRVKQVTHRDIHPKFAQEFNISYWNSSFTSNLKGDRFLASGKILLPGFIKHHNVIISAGYQENSSLFRHGIYRLTTDLESVRGYKRIAGDKIRKGMIEYTMPLFYPDLALGPFLYIKRISTNLFYDNAQFEMNNEISYFSSAGADLNFEVNWFTLLVPFEMGIRYSYCIQEEKHHFEFLLFGVSF